MANQRPTKKQVIVHIGPHKTGSTALQKFLSDNTEALERESIQFLHNSTTHTAAMMLANENFENAEEYLSYIAKSIAISEASTIILSQEDFCGSIPGRSRSKNIYPKLTKNLRIISRALRPHDVKFIFFKREENSWLRSCYHQHLKYRTLFSAFEDFEGHFRETSFAKILQKPIETFGEDLIIRPYEKSTDAGLRTVLDIAGKASLYLPTVPSKCNISPSRETIRLLERTNALSSYKPTAWFAKSLIMSDWKPRTPEMSTTSSLSTNSFLAQSAMPKLARRAEDRVTPQVVDDILPPENVDLRTYAFDILPENVELPSVSRIDIRDQSLILDYHLRGKSQLAKLNALTISYLRRATPHAQKARKLFHRIWQEQGPLLVNELSTRWIISTLQTFLDHGNNEAQRLIGSSGYFYANMMKIYEGERAIEGREQDAIYENSSPQTPNKFRGLDRYSVGGTDLLLNTNALALDLAMRDDVAGLVLIELLLRTKESGNVFTRMDKTRKEKGIAVKGFTDTWSFFEPL